MPTRLVTGSATLSDLARAVVAVMVGVLLTLILLLSVSDQPTNRALFDRQQQIMNNQQVVLCLLLYEPEERTPAAVAECSTPPATSTTTLGD